MRRILLLTAILIVLSLNIISAEIMLSQPNAIYNLGDIIDTKAVIKPSLSADGFFELNLQCGEESRNFYKSPLSLKANEEKNIETSLTLTKSFLGEMKGDCIITANFLGEQEASQSFKISDKIYVTLSAENITIEAGKQVKILGSAVKENDKKFDGFVEISAENSDIKTKGSVNQGKFETAFTFPANTRAGNYVLTARVYEESFGNEINSGEAKITLNIKKIPSKIEIAILNQNVEPGEKLIFKPLIYDQANEEVGGEISVKIYDVYDSLIFQKVLSSGHQQELLLNISAGPGYWRIEAKALGLEAKRLFFVEELEKARFEILNDTLVITNKGNVVYRKAVQISIGEHTEIKNLDLDLGESKKLRLLAPEGKYTIRVTDGKDEIIMNDVSLTGGAIGVEDIRAGLSAFIRYPIVWLFLLLIFGLFILMLVQRVAKRKFYTFPVSGGLKQIKKSESKEIIAPAVSVPETGKAEHTLVLHGRKENAGIITVKIKDLNNVKRTCSDSINNIIRTITGNRGTVYETSDYIIGIFSSPTTKTFSNDMIAVKTARRIEEILNEYNRKFRNKIDFGLSLNSGELILNKDSNVLKFTTIGNTINLAKRLAELSNNELLVSEDIYKKVMSEVKADKETRQGMNVYHITRISERDKHSDFIKGFLERQKSGK